MLAIKIIVTDIDIYIYIFNLFCYFKDFRDKQHVLIHFEILFPSLLTSTVNCRREILAKTVIIYTGSKEQQAFLNIYFKDDV